MSLQELKAAVAQLPAEELTAFAEWFDDFTIRENGRVLNVLNAPSPAATSSLNIGRLIVDQLAERL